MALTPEERAQYRSKRLRNGSNRPVSPRRATPQGTVPDTIEGMNCSCGVHLEGTQADFVEHERRCHEPPMQGLVERRRY